MSYTLLQKAELPGDEYTRDFEGYLHADSRVSFIWVDMPPGEGVRLHRHPYPEIFIIQEGTAAYTVGPATLEARAGEIIVAPANVPHKFSNTGDGPLRQIDIHVSERFITDWLEE